MKLIKDILKGVIIGVANAIPGVSGGTMMVSMGIYDDIINSVTHLFKEFKKSVMTLLPYFIGMAIGIVGLAFVIDYLFKTFPLQTKLLFIGLILGGVPVLLNKVKGKKIGVANVIVFLILFAAIILMELFGGEGKAVVLEVTPVQLLLLFVIGAVASATMIIPGVSGSMMLMILGYYSPIMSLVKGTVVALTSGDWDTVLTSIIYIIPFGLGLVVGIFAVAKLIEMLLSEYETITYSGILGLVASSPFVILMGTALASITVGSVVTGIIALALGSLAAFKLSGD
ncbi:MAG: DUF368 domain-containing protein [Lachnospiraceae bacterium]|nr:DUF368 domain-containing protein [Lachnospiraceae bacterium]